MAITLTSTEIQALKNKEAQAQSGQLKYWEIYQWLGDLLQEKGVSDADSTLLWLRGATEANAGRGAMASLIRTYTETQYQLRYGTSIPPGKLQEASDAVAQNLFDDLLGRNEPLWPAGQVPDINRIAFADATAVGKVLFDGNELDTAAAAKNNSAWSGALLFSILGSDQTARLTSGDGGIGASGRIDTLNDLRDVLYAYAAYEKALKAARNTYLLESSEQAVRDTAVLGQTISAYLQGSGSLPELAATVWRGASGAVGEAFKVMADIGSPNFLDMLMGAIVGKSQIGSTTDANFASKAKTFFGAYTPAMLQSIGAALLPIDPAGLAAKARTDVNARAALAALSVVSVQVSSTVASQFALYDPATGQGAITQNWIDDRAAFTSNFYRKLDGLGGIVNGGSNLGFFDASANTEVLVGAGSAARTRYIFGGDAADTATGQGFADHLYGGAGNETLSGLGGDDYLEGNADTDTLLGGDGTDTLVGGKNSDTYQFTADFGMDTVVDSDGLGKLMLDGVQLTGGKKVGDNKWESADRTLTYSLLAGNLVIGPHDAGDASVEARARNAQSVGRRVSRSIAGGGCRAGLGVHNRSVRSNHRRAVSTQ